VPANPRWQNFSCSGLTRIIGQPSRFYVLSFFMTRIQTGSSTEALLVDWKFLRRPQCYLEREHIPATAKPCARATFHRACEEVCDRRPRVVSVWSRTRDASVLFFPSENFCPMRSQKKVGVEDRRRRDDSRALTTETLFRGVYQEDYRRGDATKVRCGIYTAVALHNGGLWGLDYD